MHIIFISIATLLLTAGGTFFVLERFRRNKEKQPQDKVDITTTAFDLLFKDLPTVPEELVQILTYEEVIKYLARCSSDPEIKKISRKGIVFRQFHALGQTFLDENNQIILDSQAKPYGRQLIAKELDDELKETFGDKHYFIVT